MAGRRIVVEFLGRDAGLGKTAGDVEGKMGKLSGKFQQFGAKAGPFLAAGFVAGGAAMVKFGNQASDLAETQSKVNQIFGRDGAKALDAFAAGAAKSMGQSKQTALDAASTFGIIGKGAGLAGDGLVDFSKQMTGLASDMASFNNTSPEEAIEAIGSAMRGEAEPIRKYGVMLDDATLRAEAMKLGLIKTTKEALTPQQKALAAQSAILKQTKDQQGDFARTSDGLANKQRIVKAEFENLTTQLGQKALPVMLKVTEWANKAVEWMGKHKELVKGIAVVVGPLVVGLYALSVAQRAVNLAMAANPIGLIVIAIAALAAGIVYAYKKSETFRNVVDAAFGAVSKAASFMWNNVLKPTFKFIINAWLTVAGSILNAAAKAFGWVPGLGGKLKAAAAKFEEFKRDVNNKLDGIKPAKVRVDTAGAKQDLREFRGFYLDLLGKLPKKVNVHVGKAGSNLLTQGLGHNAGGTNNWRGGPTWVGERGPEIVNLPRGSQVIPNHKIGGGSQTVVHVLDLRLNGKTIRKMLLDEKRLLGGVNLGIA